MQRSVDVPGDSNPDSRPDLDALARHLEYGHLEGQDYAAIEWLLAEVDRLSRESEDHRLAMVESDRQRDLARAERDLYRDAIRRHRDEWPSGIGDPTHHDERLHASLDSGGVA